MGKKKKPVKLLVITFAPTILKDGKYYSYAPLVNEMNLWFKYADEFRIISPFSFATEILSTSYDASFIKRYHIPFISFVSVWQILRSLLLLPYICFQLFRAMLWANHLHFRCPGNISLIAGAVQVLFPRKKKTVKYAGNWDPKSQQPWSYRWQQAIFRNTFWSRKTRVLVYGKWPNETSNILPFMAATYRNEERVKWTHRAYDSTLEFVFAGSLVVGKRPLLTVQIIEGLIEKGYSCKLHMYGDGPLKPELEAYLKAKGLQETVILYGNRDKTEVKARLQAAHFSILPSKSEGWPKAIAEGMFFGAIPIATRISCVPWMLDEGERGILISSELEAAVETIHNHITDRDLSQMSRNAMAWSQDYTLDRFESEIQKLIQDS